MAYVKMSFDDLTKASDAIDAFVNQTKIKMGAAKMEVNVTLALSWSGVDYRSFQSQWSTLGQKDSSTNQMLSQLHSYSMYLDFVSKQYKKARDNANALAATLII